MKPIAHLSSAETGSDSCQNFVFVRVEDYTAGQHTFVRREGLVHRGVETNDRTEWSVTETQLEVQPKPVSDTPVELDRVCMDPRSVRGLIDHAPFDPTQGSLAAAHYDVPPGHRRITQPDPAAGVTTDQKLAITGRTFNCEPANGHDKNVTSLVTHHVHLCPQLVKCRCRDADVFLPQTATPPKADAGFRSSPSLRA